MEPEPVKTRGPTEQRRWPAWLIIAVFLLSTLPLRFQATGPSGIDTSHTWAINYGFAQDVAYGQDLVFTYGPLGFISEPLDMGWNLIIANLARLGLHLLLGVGLVLLSKEAQSLARLVTGLLLLSLAWSLYDLALITITTICVWCQVAVQSRRWWQLLPCSVLAGMLPLVKLSLGVTATAMLGLALLAGDRRWRRDWRAWAAAGAAAPVFLVTAMLSLGSFESIGLWLGRSLEIVSGYSSAMSLTGPHLELVAGLTLLVAWLIMTAWLRSDPELGTLSAILLPAVIVSFRLGFVRHDVHVYNFFGLLLGALSLMVLLSSSRRKAIGLGLAFAAVLGVTGAGTLEVMPRLAAMPRRLSGLGAVEAVARLIDRQGTRETLAAESRGRLADLGLPETWLSRLQASRNGVGALPWENLYCPANDLIWSPTPTCQLYQAYTRPLDAWTASHYRRNEAAPQWIVVHIDAMGMRHPLHDAPLTWREILSHYRLDEARADLGLLLLERLDHPRLDEPIEISSRLLHLNGRGLEVPQSTGLVLAEVDLEPTLAGAIQRSLFRLPPVYLVLHRASGLSHGIRVVPEVSAHGLLINRYPHLDTAAWAALWTGEPVDPVVRISIGGPGTDLLKEPAPVRWIVIHQLPAPAKASS